MEMQLSKDLKKFECKGNLTSYQDTQKFELTGISSAISVKIIAPSDLTEDKITIDKKDYLLVNKNQDLNLTCEAKIGCNDIYYNLNVITNSMVIYIFII